MTWTLESVELRRIAMPLVSPFRTSFGSQTERDILLVRIRLADASGGSSDTIEGWGECVALSEPSYSPEYVDGAEHVIVHHLLPRLMAAGPIEAHDVAPSLAKLHGHPMAKAALEMAVLDAQLRASGQSFAAFLGAENTRIPSGVSVGIHDTTDELLAAVQGYVDDGYFRIKLKIEPGSDIEQVAAVRELIGPGTPFQVDANTAYRRTDGAHLARLDEFDLLLIEQPLPEDDIIGHARLAAEVETPICLDESLVSASGTADAINSGRARSRTSSPAGLAAISKRSASTTCASQRGSRCGAVGCWRPGSVEPPTRRSRHCPGSRCRATSVRRRASTRRHRHRPDHDHRRPRHGADESRARVRPRPGLPRLGHDEPSGHRHARYSHRTMTHPFLSEEWMAAAHEIREKYADQVPPVTTVIKINQVIVDVPFGDGEVKSYLDTSSGHLVMELGELDDADATVTTDYDTAKAMFVDQDQAIAMQAFMSGKIKVQGDMMKMMAMQTAIPSNEFTDTIADEIKAITAP